MRQRTLTAAERSGWTVVRSAGIPVPRDRLIGREREVATNSELMLRGDVRLLTLTGAGGVGKTRLAVEIAHRVSGEFADGTWFVSLASIADPNLVLSQLGRTLGYSEEGSRSLLDRLLDTLEERQLLLVLDNFEQVLAAAPTVAELLNGCPELKVLATSRAPLHLSGEREYPVAPLPTPTEEETSGARSALRSPAVSLFVERARAADPAFQLTNAKAPDVARICARLDGVPLAIELAAARIKVLSPQEMLKRLHDPLELLTRGPGDAPERQQTLRNTLAWSHELLSPSEQQLFARLGVFSGGCTLEAAEGVGEVGPNTLDVLEAISTLVDHNLLQRLEADGGEVRFGMLETIRQFALERLWESGEERIVREAHASMFAALAEEAEVKLRTQREEQWLQRLDAEHDNLRSALRWCLDTGAAAQALRVAGALARYWLIRGYLSEGRSWLKQALELGAGASPGSRAKALSGAGLLAHYQNDYELTLSYFSESLALYRDLEDRRGIATALSGLAAVIGRHRDSLAAQAMYEEALEIARGLGDREEIVRLQERLGTLIWYGGDNVTARPLLEESLDKGRNLGLRHETAGALQALGWVALAEGDAVQARRLLAEAVGVVRELGDRWSLARALFGLGLAALERGALDDARGHLGEALRLDTDLGDKLMTCGCLGGLASIAAHEGRPEAAVPLSAAAERLRRSMNANHSVCVATIHKRGLDRARTALDAQTFESAWDRGRSLSLEDVLELARTEASRRAGGGYPCGLSAREVEVLQLVAAGLTDAQAADELVVSVRTVHAHMRSIYTKLGVGSRSAATRWAVERAVV